MTTETNTLTLPEAMELLREPTVTAEKLPFTGLTHITLWPRGTAQGASDKTVVLSRKQTIALRNQLNAILG